MMTGLTPGTIKYGPIVGSSAGTTLSAGMTVMPPGPTLVAKDLVAMVPTAPGPEHFVNVELQVNESNSQLVCPVLNTNARCESISGASAQIPGGARVEMQVTTNAGTVSTSVSWGFRLEPAG
jgi:hypothetical protein